MLDQPWLWFVLFLMVTLVGGLSIALWSLHTRTVRPTRAEQRKLSDVSAFWQPHACLNALSRAAAQQDEIDDNAPLFIAADHIRSMAMLVVAEGMVSCDHLQNWLVSCLALHQMSHSVSLSPAVTVSFPAAVKKVDALRIGRLLNRLLHNSSFIVSIELLSGGLLASSKDAPPPPASESPVLQMQCDLVLRFADSRPPVVLTESTWVQLHQG